MQRAANAILRSANLLGKFVSILIFAEVLSPAEVGIVGLVVASVSYCVYLIGFDFYSFANREVSPEYTRFWADRLWDQAAFFSIIYSFVIPAVFYFTNSTYFSLIYSFLIAVILLFEHSGQEMCRFLIVSNRQLASSIALLLRGGGAFLVGAVLMLWLPDIRSLGTIFVAWAIGGGISVGFCAAQLLKMNPVWTRRTVDWNWIRKGVRVALPLLVSALCLRGIFTADRYMVKAQLGLDIAGAYTVYIGVVLAVFSFIDASVFVYAYPNLIANHKSKNFKSYIEYVKKMTKNTITYALILFPASVAAMNVLVNYMGTSVYNDNIALFYALIPACVLYVLGMIPHYILYSMGMDRAIISAHGMGFATFLLCGYLTASLTELAVPVSMGGAGMVIFIWKIAAVYRCWRRLPDLMLGK